MTLLDVIDTHLKSNEETLFHLLEGDECRHSKSYQELMSDAKSFARWLASRFEKQSRIILIYPQGLEFISAFMGCLYAGMIAVPAYPVGNPKQTNRLLNIISSCNPQLVIGNQQNIDDFNALNHASPIATQVVEFPFSDTSAQDPITVPEVYSEMIAFIQYSSGSTGNPKGIMVSHGNLLHNLDVVTRTFNLGTDKPMVMWLPFQHDFGLIGMVLSSLYNKNNLVILNPLSVIEKPYRWLKAISDYKASITAGPNFSWLMCVGKITPEQIKTLNLSSLIHAWVAGEPNYYETMQLFCKKFSTCGFDPKSWAISYGLAENTLQVTSVPSGKCSSFKILSKTQLEQGIVASPKDEYDKKYIMTAGELRPEHEVTIVNPVTKSRCAPNEVGEIWVHSQSVTQGYWGEPEETDEIFHAHIDNEDKSWLRTGDLGFIDSGELYLTGRYKDLMIIDGRDIYPQDLEDIIDKCNDSIRPNSCAAFSIDTGTKEKIVICVELKSETLTHEQLEVITHAIRKAIAEQFQLAVYDIKFLKPRHALKTTSGKIQRKATKNAYMKGTLELIGSNVNKELQEDDEVAKDLYQIFCDTLGVEHIQADHGFFSLGGTSGHATLLHQRLQDYFGSDRIISPTIAFEFETIQATIHFLQQHPESLNKNISASSQNQVVPTTEGQKEIWLTAQLGTEASLAYNLSFHIDFSGQLNTGLLQQAVKQLIERHESLRTTFSSDGSELHIHDHITNDVMLIDLSNTPSKEAKLKLMLKNEVETPFQFETGPLIRFRIIKMDSQNYVMTMTLHHLICDGWSCVILLEDLASYYRAAVLKSPAQLKDVYPFSTYVRAMAEHLKTPDYSADEAYWLKTFQEIPNNLNLPTDRPRPPIKTYSAGHTSYHIDKALTSKIKKLGAQQGCSFVQTLFAGFQVLMYRLSQQEDLVVGLLARGHEYYQTLVGHCVSILPVRHSFTAEMTFLEFLASLKNILLNAYKHRNYTLGTLVQKLTIERDVSRLPLCSVFFSATPNVRLEQFDFPNLKVQIGLTPRTFENFELILVALEQSGAVTLDLQYNSDLFDESTITHYMSCFETLLRGLVENPDQNIAQLPILSNQDQKDMLYGWNQTQQDFDQQATIQQLFSQQASLTPDRIAVQFELKESLSYEQLDKKSNQLARYLQNSGVKKGNLIGLFLNRGVDVLVSMLAIFKSGCAYVPLDPVYPKDRIELMIHDSQMSYLICESTTITALPENKATVLLIDAEAKLISECSDESLERISKPEDTAYVIYTSGSTGKPKGVSISHRSLVNFQSSMKLKPGINQDDVLVAIASFSFDVSCLDLFLPIITGAKVVIASRDTAMNGFALLDLLKKSGATFLHATPATWRLLIISGWDTGQDLCPDFKILCGGEAIQMDLADQLLKRAPGFWNMYGPTETTIYTTCERITRESGPITIGRPINNTECYVLDKYLKPVPLNVPGELYIAGECLSLGYLNRPELTAERFLINPFSDYDKMYKTGDLVRYLADGRIEYLGRNDRQVKVRGYRIELQEIENSLIQHPDIQQCTVITKEFAAGDVRLVAYAVIKAGTSVSYNEACELLRTTLPDYMIPQHFVILDHFPLSPSGKIDIKALSTPIEPIDEAPKKVRLPQSERELLVAHIWSDLLKKDRISLDDNFFNLGGHSLLAMQFMTQLQDRTGFRINPRLILLSNLEAIAEQIPNPKAVTPLHQPPSHEQPANAGKKIPINPFFFDSGGKQIFGTFHAGRTQKGILMCYPIGHEYIRSHWVFHQLTQQLTAAGFSVLRFDYHATGDSLGCSEDGTVSQWKTDIVTAADKLMSMAHVNSVSIVGRRLGASLASLVSEEGLKVDDLILWDPILRGEDYLSELKAFHKQLLTTFPVSNRQITGPNEIMGFIYSDRLQAQIKAIDLTQSHHFKAQNTLIISPFGSRKILEKMTQLNAHVSCRYLEESQDTDVFAEINTILLSPQITQIIVKHLTERTA